MARRSVSKSSKFTLKRDSSYSTKREVAAMPQNFRKFFYSISQFDFLFLTANFPAANPFRFHSKRVKYTERVSPPENLQSEIENQIEKLNKRNLRKILRHGCHFPFG